MTLYLLSDSKYRGFRNHPPRFYHLSYTLTFIHDFYQEYKFDDIKDWDQFCEKRRRVFSSTWESVKHGSSGQDPNVAVNSILSDPERLTRRCQLKKSFPNRRLGQDKDKIEQQDAEQYDDTGLYQGKQKCRLL